MSPSRIQFPNKYDESQSGFNIIQMVVTLSVLGILTAIAAPSIGFGSRPLADTVDRFSNQIKLTRLKAQSMTRAVRIKPVGNNQIDIQFHESNTGTSVSECADINLELDTNGKTVWKRIPGYSNSDFKFESDVLITTASENGSVVTPTNDWRLCFNSKGISASNLNFTFTELNQNRTQSVEVFIGGGIKIN